VLFAELQCPDDLNIQRWEKSLKNYGHQPAFIAGIPKQMHNKSHKVYSAEYTDVPKAFFIPYLVVAEVRCRQMKNENRTELRMTSPLTMMINFN
jgi:hypothetical protein